jgi:hypothetical protein
MSRQRHNEESYRADNGKRRKPAQSPCCRRSGWPFTTTSFPRKSRSYFRRLGRSSGFRIKLALHLPAADLALALLFGPTRTRPVSCLQWSIAEFVPGYSGGTATDSHRLPYSSPAAPSHRRHPGLRSKTAHEPPSNTIILTFRVRISTESFVFFRMGVDRFTATHRTFLKVGTCRLCQECLEGSALPAAATRAPLQRLLKARPAKTAGAV